MEQKDFENIDKLIGRNLKRLEKNLLKEFKKTLNELKIEVSNLYEKYSDKEKGTLDFNELQKFNRYQTFDQTIQEKIFKLHSIKKELLLGGLKENFLEGYFRNAYLIEMKSKTDFNYTSLDDDFLFGIFQREIEGLTLDERLEVQREIILKTIQSEIVSGIILGKSYVSIAESLTHNIGVDYNKAIKVARTETHRIQNEARFESTKKAVEKGLKIKKKWISTLDGRTRDSHRKLDGQEVDFDDYFIIGSRKAMLPGKFGRAKDDINCRCTYINVIEEMDLNTFTRNDNVVKNSIPYQTYEEWKNKKNITWTMRE